MKSLGLTGLLAKRFIVSPLTPVCLLAAILAGLISFFTIPREQEPQLRVPLVDMVFNVDGLKAADAVELITKPAEAALRGLPGVEHIYSTTTDNHVTVSIRFVSGTDEDDAVLRVNNKLLAHSDSLPVGIPAPLIIGHGINDVAILNLTLTPKPAAADHWDAGALTALAEKLQTELVKIPGAGTSYIAGSDPREIRVEPDPERLMLYGVTLQQLVARLQEANRIFTTAPLREDGVMEHVDVGQTLNGVPDIGLLLLTTRDNHPVYVRDVANIVFIPAPAEHRVWAFSRIDMGPHRRDWAQTPAVTLALAKTQGANAVTVSDDVKARLKALQGTLIPPDIDVQVTRDEGQNAREKADLLMAHLSFATLAIVALIWLAIGWRAALVTAVVIPATILLTVFAAKLQGFSLNPVSFFALIFAVGILVDDAIVLIENISRHWAMSDGRSRRAAAIDAVDEIGNPTIVATLAVIAALLPIMFVGGLMGPFARGIPVIASSAMVLSFFTAVIIVPWLMLKIIRKNTVIKISHGSIWLTRFYCWIAVWLLATRRRALGFLLIIGVTTLLVFGSLIYFGLVQVKMLAFADQSELDVLLNLPPGASLEDTEQALFSAAKLAGTLPETVSMQAYAGTSAPYDFNGLVHQYYDRQAPELGGLHIVLVDRLQRLRSTHAIALALRKTLLAGLVLPPGTVLKIVEVPPGPPMQAGLVAEIYGPDLATRRAVAQQVEEIFKAAPYAADVDTSFGLPPPRLSITVNQDQLEYFHVQQADVYDTLDDLFDGANIGYSFRGADRLPLEIAVGLPKSDMSWNESIAVTPVPANVLPGARGVVELGQLVNVQQALGSPTIYRRDGRFADLVTAEPIGEYGAPIYAMFALDRKIQAADWHGLPVPKIRFTSQPTDETVPSILWTGEWETTLQTFHDLGAAFVVALLVIYILVVGLFGSFTLPLVVLTPIPLTLIGIVLGHWLMGADFSATSMIGFIALAGIIVRNSILLVDFIRQYQGQGRALRDVLLMAGAVRAKPILLTALSAMISAVTILPDPTFNGLGVSLLFGLISSTFLTLLVIPAIYIVMRDDGLPGSGTIKKLSDG